MRIEIEFDETPDNRRRALRFIDHLIERGNLPVTRSLTHPYEMGKVDWEIPFTRAEVITALDPEE